MKVCRRWCAENLVAVESLRQGDTFVLNEALDAPVFLRTDLVIDGEYVGVKVKEGTYSMLIRSFRVLPVQARVLVE